MTDETTDKILAIDDFFSPKALVELVDKLTAEGSPYVQDVKDVATTAVLMFTALRLSIAVMLDGDEENDTPENAENVFRAFVSASHSGMLEAKEQSLGKSGEA